MAATDLRRVVLLAHVFPRTLEDSMGAFLLHLADGLAARGLAVDAVAPHAAGLAGMEPIGSARVHRFHYAPIRSENLAYQGTMHELVAAGLGPKVLFALFNLAFLWRAIRVVASTRAQVIHAHWWLPGGFVGALASVITRRPLVITTHGTDVEMLRRTRWARPLARFAFGRARRITCGSTYLREQLIGLGVADPARIAVIPMPINPIFAVRQPDLQIINRKSRSGAETPRSLRGEIINPKSILTVARLSAQKSIDTLIEATAILRERGADVRLTIIGDGTERGTLESLVVARGLQDRVEFLGGQPQAELPRYYAGCDVFVLPSVREGMGLVLAEAILCGAPVIAANSGGVTDIVRDGETGLLFPERDPRALAEAIQKLLDDRALAERLAQNGRAWVCDHFTPERVAGEFARIYQEAGAG